MSFIRARGVSTATSTATTSALRRTIRCIVPARRIRRAHHDLHSSARRLMRPGRSASGVLVGSCKGLPIRATCQAMQRRGARESRPASVSCSRTRVAVRSRVSHSKPCCAATTAKPLRSMTHAWQPLRLPPRPHASGASHRIATSGAHQGARLRQWGVWVGPTTGSSTPQRRQEAPH